MKHWQNSLAPSTPDEINVGRTDQDFTDCTKSLHVFSLINFDSSFELYQKLFLEMATSKKDYWTYRRSNTKDIILLFITLGALFRLSICTTQLIMRHSITQKKNVA